MEERFDRPKPNRQIREEAAEWLVHFNADVPDDAARAQFDAWLRTSPEHIRAYIELLPLWHDSASFADVNKLSRTDLVELATRRDTNIATLPRAGEDASADTTRPAAPLPRNPLHMGVARNHRAFAIAATLLVSLAAAFFAYKAYFSGTRHYRTDVAEVRAVTLEDGTKLTIGAKSAVIVRYTDKARTFHLDGGEIYVDVAKDAARPFFVEVKDKIIRALGTQFEVQADDQMTRVAVIEGAVSVSRPPFEGPGRAMSPDTSADSVLLKAGQQLTARRSDGLETPQPIRSKEPAAWRTGHLVFDDANLGEVVREFNRYNVKQLKLLARSLETIPIAAEFSSADPGSLIRFLRDQPGISVTEKHGEILIDAR